MRRAALLSLILAACGDNVDLGIDTSEPVAAVCSEGDLDQLLAKLPDITSVKPTACGNYVDGQVRCYLLTITQPIDHAAPTSTFPERVYLMHRGCDRPTVVADWGYSNDYFFDDELSTLFQANAIWIEHRYQGESIPAGADWDWHQLTIENGATDMHHVIDSFKHLYGAHWVSTGASKGGITATYHSFFFPHDLDGAIPYVAPASRSRVDPVYQTRIDNVLTDACAQRVRDSQVAALTTRRTMMLARLTDKLGSADSAPDYLDEMTATFDWGFWQYYGEPYCAQVPTATATDAAFWNFYAGVSGIFGPAGPGNDELSNGALDYEWLTEQGFALQIGAHVAPLLQSSAATMTMEDAFVAQFPDVELPAYDGSVTRSTRHWVEHYAKNLLLIYGDYDPWSGGALDKPTQPSSARFFVPQANHGAQIAGLADADRTVALEYAARMFGVQPVMTMMARASQAGANRDAILARTLQRHLMRLP